MTQKNKFAVSGVFWILAGMLFFATSVYAASTLTVDSQGDGYVDSYPSGILCGAACVETYTTGTVMTLTAHPTSGATFTGWTGCDSPNGTTCTINLDSDKIVAATFSGEVKTDYNLRVYRTGGLGVVQSDPFNLYCGSICPYDEAPFAANSDVKLTASAQSGYVFTGWSGDCSGTSPTCTVTMDRAKTVTATFGLSTGGDAAPSLTIQKTGTGTVTSSDRKINCGTSCSSTYTTGDAVTLTATTLVRGETFLGWGGACSGTKNTCTITMDAAKTAIATFGVPDFSLSITVEGKEGGTGAVTDQKYITCSTGTCTAKIPFGASVTLTPKEGAYSYFSGFSGSCTAGSCTFVMNAPRTVTATFSIINYTLSLGGEGSGSGAVSLVGSTFSCTPSCSTKINHGKAVTLTATPDTASRFMGWSGICTGTGNCTFIMDGPKTVTASFTRTYRLAVEKAGEETGTVVSADGSIRCGDTCAATLLEGSAVSLESTRAGIFVPNGFEGCATSDKDSCFLVLDTGKRVTARFVPLIQDTTVIKTGQGKVESADKKLSCGSTCTAKFREGSTVVLKAIPDRGAIFSRWSGGCTGRQPTCTYVVNVAEGAKRIEALFEEIPVLTVANRYGGVVSSSVSPYELDLLGEYAADVAGKKIACGEQSGTCSVEYQVAGFLVQLSLTPNSAGARWSGCSNPLVTDVCDVYIDRGSKTVTIIMPPDKERELVGQALRELFGGANPAMDSYIANENSPPFTKTLADLQSGKIGHILGEIKDWIAVNIQWYRNQGGINRITDEWERGTSKQVLFEVFAAEISAYPTLSAFLADESKQPFTSALADLRYGRGEGSSRKDALKNWISQPQNKQWYYDATGIGSHIASIEQARLEAEIAAKRPFINSISPAGGRIGQPAVIAGNFYDVQLVTLNGDSVSFTPDYQKQTITLPNIAWGVDPRGVEINTPGNVKVITTWGEASSKLISPSGPVLINANGEKEGCFPGVGQGCEGAGGFVQKVLRGIATQIGCDDPRPDGSRVCSIAAGSIAHDNCCVRNPGGKWCGGPGRDGEKAGESNHNGQCVTEWHNAFWDVANRRAWTATYSAGQEFDLTPSGRSLNNRYSLGETVTSIAYCAPGGHQIRQKEDVGYCCSGQATVESFLGFETVKCV